MRFQQLAEYFEQLEKVSGRLDMTRILAKMLDQADEKEVEKVVYLSLGQLGPSYDKIDFGLAEKMVIRSIAQAYETEPEKVLHLYKKLGDVGLVTHELSSKLNPSADGRSSKLSVVEVYSHLMQIAEENGQGSQDRKVTGLADLLSHAGPVSAKYIARIPVGKLRLGFGEMTILDALSWMVAGDKSLHGALEDAYNVAADAGYIAQYLKIHNHDLEKIHKALPHIKVKLGTPVVAALCQRLKSFDEIITKMTEVAVEPKYDGTRLQIHWRREEKGQHQPFLKSFTRNLEENSDMFPELQQLGNYVKGDAFIFDCEAVGVDPDTGKILPFQVTMTRKRKYEVQEQIAKVPLKYNIFDVLYTDEGDIHHLPLDQRRKILEKVLKPNDQFVVIRQTVTKEAAICRELHHQYLEEGLEGVVIKKWVSPYTPGRKGWNWVKMKEVESAKAGLADTLDCVVMGYYSGRGKRAGFGLGAFLVGVLDKTKTNFLTVTKIGTGLSDEQFRELKKRLDKLITKEKPEAFTVNKFLEPDGWVKPEIVVEIAADNITKSPNHSANLALRFPRLVRFRDDKNPSQASTVKEVETLYKLQK